MTRKPEHATWAEVPRQPGQPTSWLHPLMGVVKIRVDGVVARSVREGSSPAICRDSEGNYLGASALKLLVDLATMEAIACWEALALAAGLSTTDVLIATDCKQLVENIKTGTEGLHMASSLRKL